MVMSKSERLNEIKKYETKALKMFKARENGKLVNKLLEEVIRMEDAYEKEFGYNPAKIYGTTKKKVTSKKTEEPIIKERTVFEDGWENEL